MKFLYYCSDILDTLPGICTLCQEEATSYRLLPCGHIFHLPCINRWLCSDDASCPLCRRNFYYLRRPRIIRIPTTTPADRRSTQIAVFLQSAKEWAKRKCKDLQAHLLQFRRCPGMMMNMRRSSVYNKCPKVAN